MKQKKPSEVKQTKVERTTHDVINNKHIMQFPLVYRWILHSSLASDIHLWVKLVDLDMINKTIVVELYAIVDNSKMPVEEWINKLSDNTGGSLGDTITLKHYDGCGKEISAEQFSGIMPVAHYAGLDYAGTKDEKNAHHIIHVVSLKYKQWKAVTK